MHIAFSENRQKWGDTAPDALTVMLSPVRLWIRSGLFSNFLPAPAVAMSANRWHNIRIFLSQDRLRVTLDGKQIADNALNGIPFPTRGFVGIIFWDTGFAPGHCAIRHRGFKLNRIAR